MEQSLSLVTLGVADLSVTHSFYVDGLGWSPLLVVPDEVIFIQVGHGLLLSLWNSTEMIEEAGPIFDARGGDGAPPITLGHLTSDEAAVDAVLERAAAAGSPRVLRGQRRSWGGYSGYFSDPDGYRWEIAYNPGLQVDADGTVRFGEAPQ